MENQHQKWVTLSYVGIAALLAFIVFQFSLKLVGAYDLERMVRNIDLVVRMGSLAIGALAFFILLKNDKSNQFMNEVVVELSRVTWPTQKETSSATIVVLIMVLISGMVLGLLDYFWTLALKMIL